MNQRRRGRFLEQDPLGRIDVLLYRVASRRMEQLEREHQWTGLREHLLPVVEKLIVRYVPAGKIIPPEVEALLRFAAANQWQL